jgi:uncharacterized membrane protein YfcA
MSAQSILLLVVAAVLVTLGITQISRSRRRNRAQRQRNQIGMLLILIGVVIGFITLFI